MSGVAGGADEGVLIAEEKALLDASILICEALERRGLSRRDLAVATGVSASEITQRLRGTRNLTLRSLVDMLHAMDYDLVLRTRDLRAAASSGAFISFGVGAYTTISATPPLVGESNSRDDREFVVAA